MARLVAVELMIGCHHPLCVDGWLGGVDGDEMRPCPRCRPWTVRGARCIPPRRRRRPKRVRRAV